MSNCTAHICTAQIDLDRLRDRLWDVMRDHGTDTAGMEDEPRIAALAEMLSADREERTTSYRHGAR